MSKIQGLLRHVGDEGICYDVFCVLKFQLSVRLDSEMAYRDVKSRLTATRYTSGLHFRANHVRNHVRVLWARVLNSWDFDIALVHYERANGGP